MRYTRTILVAALLATVPLAVGFGLGESKKRKERDKLGEMKQMVQAVKLAFEGCKHPDAAILMAEVGLVHLGTEGGLPDATARLSKALPTIQDPAVRNFTRFAIAVTEGQAKRAGGAADQLEKVIEENAARLSK